MDGYTITLTIHSYLRWAVLILGLLAVARALSGWLGRKRWEAADQKVGLLFIISLDLQFLVGILLFGIFSPITQMMFQNAGAVMQNRAARFIAVEHAVFMLVGIVLAHIGRARARRIDDSVRKHKITAIFFGLALLAILAGIPWPFLEYGRPWIR